MNRLLHYVSICALCLVCVLAAIGAADAQKVLIVTTEQATMPSQGPTTDGQYIITDLVAAGYPFDVVTYGRYVSMPLDAYDIIILSGHTSPTPVSAVATTTQAAMAAGKKIFINGSDCYYRYSTSGSLLEMNLFYSSLFPVQSRISRAVSGVPSIPAAIEKDASISSLSYSISLFTYTLASPPAMTISLGGYTVGFLYPNGGLIESRSSSYPLYWLDYGKVVSYLRYGRPTVIGFANDRIEGAPVASIEVHCHGDYKCFDWLNNLTLSCNMPLTNCLTSSWMNASLMSKWKQYSDANPLMLIGSHSRTHPADWTQLTVSSALDETFGSIADIRNTIPQAECYVSFSGSMNPTTAEIDAMYTRGLVFGAAGYGSREMTLPNGSIMYIQTMPTRSTWIRSLSMSSTTPYWPSQTLVADNAIRDLGHSYLDDIRQEFQANLKYGLYSYGFIHDTLYTPNATSTVGGVLFSTTMRQGIEYLRDQGVKFIDTRSLMLRLQDYMAGNVSVAFTDGTHAVVTVTRPSALANEVKIGCTELNYPVAQGSSVLSQRACGNMVYITLRPEVVSVFDVIFQQPKPASPVVTAPQFTNGDLSASWRPAEGPWAFVEYQYALGSSAGAADVLGWTSAGTDLQCNLRSLPLADEQSCYLSVKARTSNGAWSDPGVSQPITADLGAPSVDGADVTQVTTGGAGAPDLLVSCLAHDLTSGITAYTSGIGTTAQDPDVVGWRDSSPQSSMNLGPVVLQPGKPYYVFVKAKNGAGTWSPPYTQFFIAPPFRGDLKLARQFDDVTQVEADNVYVTAVFGDCAYVETPDRIAGIKVASTAGIHVGQKLGVLGILQKPGVERVLTQASTIPAGSDSDVNLKPMAMPLKLLGGRDLDASNPGVTGGVGVYNIGLLVRVCGRVTHSQPDFFYIDDGSALADGSGWTGVRVTCEEFTAPKEGAFVTATGISTILRINSASARCVRLTTPPSVQPG